MISHYTWTDNLGDEATIEIAEQTETAATARITSAKSEVWLDQDQLRQLRDWIDSVLSELG